MKTEYKKRIMKFFWKDGMNIQGDYLSGIIPQNRFISNDRAVRISMNSAVIHPHQTAFFSQILRTDGKIVMD